MADFKRVILSRYNAWRQDGMIFECSLFQNIVEEMMLFRCASDEEIMDFYRRVRKALNHQAYRIVYLKAEDIAGNVEIIRKERADEKGNEIWFPLMLGFFNASPYAAKKGLQGQEALLEHFMRRQNLELKTLEEIFPEKYTLLPSKRYTDAEVEALGAIKQA